jgi:hypothetical protein
MIKTSISEEFLRHQDKSLLAPLLNGSSSDYAGVLMYKSLEQMKASDDLKNRLAKIVEDAKPLFPGFTFEKVPYYWLIKVSKAKNSVLNLTDSYGNNYPVIIVRHLKEKDRSIGYDYIDLSRGKFFMVRSPKNIELIENALSSAKTNQLSLITSINRNTNLLLRDKESYDRNERLAAFQRGDVSNLIPAISMLERCRQIVSSRISRLESIKSYYENEANKVKNKGSPKVFKSVKSIIDEEISNAKSNFIKTDIDIMNALVMRYIGKEDEFNKKANEGFFNDILNKGKQKHNIPEILKVVSDILMALKEESERKKQKRIDYTKERSEKIESEQSYPATGIHDMFSVFPQLSEESFKNVLPKNIKGFQGEHKWLAEKFAVAISTNEHKLKSMHMMLMGVEKILQVLKLKRETKSLSINNFTEADINMLREALASCMSLANSYKQKIIIIDKKTKERRFNKNMLGSIFSDTALDFFAARYIAVVISYIEMVFTKHNRID